MEEIWKAIPGYEGRYEASTEGRIRSVDHYSPQFISDSTKCLKTNDRILHFEPIHLSKHEYTAFIRELSEIALTK